MKRTERTKFWILLFAILLCLGAGGVYFAHRFASSAVTARVSVDGECIRQINLRSVTLPYEFTVETVYGRNVVRVEQGQIAVVEADCPDKICVHQGFVGESGIPIVCLPHKLVIELEDGR